MLKKINLLRFIIIFSIYLLPILLLKTDYTFLNSLKIPTYALSNPIVFMIIWNFIFICLSIFFTMIIDKYGYSATTKTTYLLLFLNYILIIIFTPIFSSGNNLYLSFCITLFILMSTILLIIETASINKKLIGWLMPSLVWTFYALIIILNIYFMN